MDWPVAGEHPRRRAFSLAILVSPQFLHATREHVCYSAIVVRNVCDGAVLPVWRCRPSSYALVVAGG